MRGAPSLFGFTSRLKGGGLFGPGILWVRGDRGWPVCREMARAFTVSPRGC